MARQTGSHRGAGQAEAIESGESRGKLECTGPLWKASSRAPAGWPCPCKDEGSDSQQSQGWVLLFQIPCVSLHSIGLTKGFSTLDLLSRNF